MKSLKTCEHLDTEVLDLIEDQLAIHAIPHILTLKIPSKSSEKISFIQSPKRQYRFSRQLTYHHNQYTKSIPKTIEYKGANSKNLFPFHSLHDLDATKKNVAKRFRSLDVQFKRKVTQSRSKAINHQGGSLNLLLDSRFSPQTARFWVNEEALPLLKQYRQIDELHLVLQAQQFVLPMLKGNFYRSNPLILNSLTFFPHDNYHDNDFRDFANSLQCFKNIKSLSVQIPYYSTVTNKGFEHLVQNFGSLAILENLKLRFRHKQIRDEEIEQFSNELQRMSGLKTLILQFYNNSISDMGIKQLFIAIKQLDKVQDLNLELGYNQITNKSFLCSTFDQFIGTYSQRLKSFHLDLSENIGLSDEGIIKICLGLRECIQIKQLSLLLEKLNITEDCLRKILKCVKKIKMVEQLRINVAYSLEKIGDVGAVKISKYFAKLKNLKALELQFMGNSITDTGAKMLIDSILQAQDSQVSQLKIYFHFNKLSAKGKEDLHKRLSQQLANFEFF